MPFGISFGKSSKSSKVKIPKFLRPLFEEGADVVQTGIEDLQTLSDPLREFIAGFTPQEKLAQALATERALDDTGDINLAQNIFRRTAAGVPTSRFLPEASTSTLEALAGGSTDPEIRARLAEIMNAGDLAGTDALAGIESGVNDVTREGLEATARGDFLYGGDAFDQAIEAAMRKFRPQILSTFGGSGPGGYNSTLAQEAIGQAFADTFASQFSTERGRQLSALESLAELDFADRGQRADIAALRGDVDLAGRSSARDAATSLAGIDSADAGTRLSAADRLAVYGDRERDRQIGAAAALPDVATADINLLTGVGEDIRELEQARLDAPRDAQLEMLQILFPGLNLNSLLGNKTKGGSKGLSFGI